jgi:hypothetical protein
MPPGLAPAEPPVAPADALRDAARILERAEADEAAADEARDLHRFQPMAALEPDHRIGSVLRPGERVFAMRRHAVLDRQAAAHSTQARTPAGGALYLTSRSLILIGRQTIWLELDEIAEILLSGERLFLVMQDGEGAVLDVVEPRLLRVEIAAARLGARG